MFMMVYCFKINWTQDGLSDEVYQNINSIQTCKTVCHKHVSCSPKSISSNKFRNQVLSQLLFFFLFTVDGF